MTVSSRHGLRLRRPELRDISHNNRQQQVCRCLETVVQSSAKQTLSPKSIRGRVRCGDRAFEDLTNFITASNDFLLKVIAKPFEDKDAYSLLADRFNIDHAQNLRHCFSLASSDVKRTQG